MEPGLGRGVAFQDAQKRRPWQLDFGHPWPQTVLEGYTSSQTSTLASIEFAFVPGAVQQLISLGTGGQYSLTRPSAATDGRRRAHMDVLVACRARQYDTAAARM